MAPSDATAAAKEPPSVAHLSGSAAARRCAASGVVRAMARSESARCTAAAVHHATSSAVEARSHGATKPPATEPAARAANNTGLWWSGVRMVRT